MPQDSEEQKELRRLEALVESGLLSSKPRPELDAIAEEAKRHFNVPMAVVTLLTEDKQLLKARAGLDLTETPRDLAFCNYTIQADKVFVVADTLADPRFATHKYVLGEPFLRFYAGAPLIYRDELRLGALCLLDTKPRRFSPGDRAELAGMAEQVISAVIDGQFDDL